MRQRIALCPSCQARLKFGDDRKMVTCPRCETRFAVSVRKGVGLNDLRPAEDLGAGLLSAAADDPRPTMRPPRSSAWRGVVIGGALIGGVVGAAVATFIVGMFWWTSRDEAPQVVERVAAVEPRDERPPDPPAEPIAAETPTMSAAAASLADDTGAATGAHAAADGELDAAATEVVETEVTEGVAASAPLASDTAPAPHDEAPESEPLAGLDREPSRPTDDARERRAERTDRRAGKNAVPTDLLYDWQPGKRADYKFTVTAEVEGQRATLSGTCTYTVAQELAAPTDSQESSGTAFVVSKDGYLVTCAHVVEDAKDVKVTLGDQQWTAEVVEVDPVQDLALLRVAARGLPSLTLADAPDVELAQSIRVVGYPLSTVLGKGVKITSGTVAGTTETDDEGAENFQVDASINPGNSGGPLVDDAGRVVGVASQLFSGARVSEVGFAVPVRQVRELLQRAGVRPTSMRRARPQSGPELARMVTPSVAYVEVLQDPTIRQPYRVNYNVSYSTTVDGTFEHEATAGRWMLPRSGFRPPKWTSGSFDVTRIGVVTEYRGDEVLPVTSDRTGLLAIENLEHKGRTRWSIARAMASKFLKRDSPFSGHRFGRRLRPPPGLPDSEFETVPALEQIEYEIKRTTSRSIVLEKKYEFRTLEQTAAPRFEHVGSGMIHFDRELGLPRSLEFQLTVSRRGDDGTVESVPVSFEYTLRDPAEVAAEMEQATRQAAEREEAQTVENPERVAELVKALEPRRGSRAGREGRRGRRGRTPPGFANGFDTNFAPRHTKELNELAQMAVVPDRQNDVAEILLHYATSGASIEQHMACKGLVRWATEEQVPGMIELLTTDDAGINWPERKDLIKSLARFSSPEVYRAIASRLPYFTESQEATEALVGFGSDAEEAVAEMLDSKSEDARRAVAEILEQIGTRRSLAALRRAYEEEPDTFTKMALQRAGMAIQSRR